MDMYRSANLHSLPAVVSKRKKRVGRGLGSGKGGHTVGRGQKGQKSREKVSVSFFGTKVKLSLLKRIPMMRGKGKNKSLYRKPVVIPLTKLEIFPKGTKVNIESLSGAGIIKEKDARRGVKIVGGGKIDKSLIFEVPTSRAIQKLTEKPVKGAGDTNRKRVSGVSQNK